MRRVLPIAVVLVLLAGVLVLALRDDPPPAAPTGVMRVAPAAGADPSFALPATPPAAPTEDAAPTDLATPAAPAPPLVVAVRHADGAPAAGCVVVLARDGRPQWHALTDAAGLAVGTGLDGDVVAWVSGATLDPIEFPLSAPRGRVELTLPEGQSVQGWVLVDGAPPAPPFVLGLSTQGRRDDVPQAIGPLFAPGRAEPGAGRLHLGQVVGADGAFRFVGGAKPWKTTVTIPTGFVAEDGESLDVRAPDTSRTLRLRRLPRLQLRVLMPDGRPAAAATVGANVRGGGTSQWNNLLCDAEGRVTIPGLAAARSEFVNVTLVSADRDARRRVELPVPVGDADCDLGDVQLESAWTVQFRVLGADGAPLAGGMGATTCEGIDLRSALTGADGLGRLAGVPAGCAELLVGAPLHENATVPLPPTLPSEPIDVTLAPCASLTVRVVAPDGGERPGLMLVLSTRTRSQRYVPRGRALQEMRRLGITKTATSSYDMPEAGSDGEMGLTASLAVPSNGIVVVGCVEPGDALDLRLVDATCSVLWSRAGLILQPGQQELLTIPLATAPGTLDVHVTRPDGSPLSGALVVLDVPDPDAVRSGNCQPRAETDASGSCRFENLYAPRVGVTCSLAGFASARQPDEAVPGAADVVLADGLQVLLHVVDGAGRPVPVPSVSVRREDGLPLPRGVSAADPSAGAADEESSSSAWRFRDLPAGPVILSTRLCGRSIELEHDAREPEARLVVPATGALVVRGLPAPTGESLILLTAEGDAGSDLSLSGYLTGREPEGEWRWPLVLPGTWRISAKADELGGPGHLRLLRGPVVVEVRAGEETVVDLH